MNWPASSTSVKVEQRFGIPNVAQASHRQRRIPPGASSSRLSRSFTKIVDQAVVRGQGRRSCLAIVTFSPSQARERRHIVVTRERDARGEP